MKSTFSNQAIYYNICLLIYFNSRNVQNNDTMRSKIVMCVFSGFNFDFQLGASKCLITYSDLQHKYNTCLVLHFHEFREFIYMLES